ncbi:MAG: alpha/beta fold hydrolase [Candidatus Latescibacterota bacterium]|nr:MAG: alpha/beta fold hydrolase [Candidatus Latescibacterota bacterium]
MLTRPIKFDNPAGDTLAALLDLPLNRKPRAFALFAHCFTCSKNYRYVRHISRALCGNGIAVFRFDFTGLGESEGEFADTSFSSNVDDLVGAAEYLSAMYRAPEILIGHSWGGAAVIQAASRIPSSVAVATIGAPSDPGHVARHLEAAADTIADKGEAEVVLAGRSFRIKKQFLDDLESTRMQQTIRNLNRALLVCHSPVDEVVSIENAQEIFVSARHPKSFVSLDRADHLLSEEADSCYVGDVVAAWAGRYIGVGTESPPGEDQPEVVVRTGRERYRTEIAAGVHTLVSDEPVSLGGGDRGPTPYQYLLSALGACTGITLRMYADRHKWPVDEIVVRLAHKNVHAADCEDCDTNEGKIDHIGQTIELGGALDAEQRTRLREIADRCPVRRTLHSKVVVKTQLSDDEA